MGIAIIVAFGLMGAVGFEQAGWPPALGGIVGAFIGVAFCWVASKVDWDE